MLVSSMNPCPCGYYNHPEKDCTCSAGTVQKYLNKISGPLLDRIDIQVEIAPVSFDKISSQESSENSEVIRNRVIKARKLQSDRFVDTPYIHCNAQMTPQLMQKFAQPNKEGLDMLQKAMNMFNLSARAYDRILKVSRTIADLDNSEIIKSSHIAEAISYRNLDRESWGNK